MAVNANTAFAYGWDGIGVAIVDSGIANHPDLKNSKGALRVVYQQDFVGGGTDDHYGHGQSVAGITGGNLINLRVPDQNGHGIDSGVIAAIRQAINSRSKYNIRVMNLSLGRPVYESYTLDPLCQAVEQAWKAVQSTTVLLRASNRDGLSALGRAIVPGRFECFEDGCIGESVGPPRQDRAEGRILLRYAANGQRDATVVQRNQSVSKFDSQLFRKRSQCFRPQCRGWLGCSRCRFNSVIPYAQLTRHASENLG